jgi:glutamate dehydrogenase/leucine dehydrogenase
MLRRIAISLALLVLFFGSDAFADDITVLSGQHVSELKAEAQQQLKDAQKVHRGDAKTLGYTKAEIRHGETPSMIRKGEFEVKLKDGTRIAFPWYRVGFAENAYANNGKAMKGGANAAETNKGGIRIHQGVFLPEVEALALKMDRKLRLSGDALAGHAVRGAKGGVGPGRVLAVGSKYKATLTKGDHIDPASKGINRKQLMRRFATAYLKSGGQVGIGSDIQAGDVNTKQPEMMALAKQYAKLSGSKIPSIGVSGKELVHNSTTGKVSAKGGIQYRSVSTGEGVAMAAQHAAKSAGLNLKGATVVSQGWGEVGKAFGMALVRGQAKVIAIEERWLINGKTLTGTLEHPKGAKATHAESVKWLGQIQEFRQQWAAHMGDPKKAAPNLKTFQGGELMKGFTKGKSVFTVKADIVGVNALGGTVTQKAVGDLLKSGTSKGKAKVYVEGANLAATSRGAAALDRAKSKIIAVPGDLANLGGVHVSNIEALQNSTGRVVSNEAARSSLNNVIAKAWTEAGTLAKKHNISIRAGVELLATSRMMKTTLQKSDATKIDLKSQIFAKKLPSRTGGKVTVKRAFKTSRTRVTRRPTLKSKATRARVKAKVPKKAVAAKRVR